MFFDHRPCVLIFYLVLHPLFHFFIDSKKFREKLALQSPLHLPVCHGNGNLIAYTSHSILFGASLHIVFHFRKNRASFEDIVYVKPYCRIQPYLVGMMLGYLLFKKHHFQGTFKWASFVWKLICCYACC